MSLLETRSWSHRTSFDSETSPEGNRKGWAGVHTRVLEGTGKTVAFSPHFTCFRIASTTAATTKEHQSTHTHTTKNCREAQLFTFLSFFTCTFTQSDQNHPIASKTHQLRNCFKSIRTPQQPPTSRGHKNSKGQVEFTINLHHLNFSLVSKVAPFRMLEFFELASSPCQKKISSNWTHLKQYEGEFTSEISFCHQSVQKFARFLYVFYQLFQVYEEKEIRKLNLESFKSETQKADACIRNQPKPKK